MKILKELLLIFAVYLASQMIEALLPFPIPANVIGIILMLALLGFKLIPVSVVREAGDFLMAHITLMLIPVNVKVMNYFDLILSNIVPFLIIGIITTVVTYVSVAWTVRFTQKLIHKEGEE